MKIHEKEHCEYFEKEINGPHGGGPWGTVGGYASGRGGTGV